MSQEKKMFISWNVWDYKIHCSSKLDLEMSSAPTVWAKGYVPWNIIIPQALFPYICAKQAQTVGPESTGEQQPEGSNNEKPQKMVCVDWWAQKATEEKTQNMREGPKRQNSG